MKEAMNLALDALKELVAQNENRYWAIKHDHFAMQDARFAIARLREALAKQEQDMPKIGCANHDCDKCKEQGEPVAWKNAAIRLGEELSSVGPDGYYDMTAEQWLDWAMEQNPQGRNSLAQQEQGEPVAWMRQDGQRVTTASDRHNYPDYETRYSIPLYTTPQQRKPLTDEQAMDAYCETPPFGTYKEAFIAGIRFIEAAHGIKE